jgi:hypothetical protein
MAGQGQKAVGVSSQPIDVGLATGSPVSPGGSPTLLNKKMTASVTTVDGSLACASPVAQNPVFSSDPNSGYIGVGINGVWFDPANAPDASKACYFSGDGGVTVRPLRSVVAGDLLYWNGSIAGFNLDGNDAVDFFYNV